MVTLTPQFTRGCGRSMKEKIQTVLLINAGNDDTQPNVTNYAIFPPLNILSIASTVKKQFREMDVRIYDGQLLSVEKINAWISSLLPDVVGISVLSGSYKNAIMHAKAAKKAGAITILGNDHAAVYRDEILRRFGALNGSEGKYVDYICTADVGEMVFCNFLRILDENREKSDLPKLIFSEQVYQTRGIVHENGLAKSGKYLLDQIPLADWELIRPELWKYKERFHSIYDGVLDIPKDSLAVTINRARGCKRFRDPCLYCGIMDLKPRFSSPTVFWREVREAKKKVGANIFYEALDSMSSFPWWADELVRYKPKDIEDIMFFVYSDALGVNENLCLRYEKLGVILVNMGLDSGDDRMLRRLKSNYDSVEANRNAARLLQRHKIGIYASFVLGAPGETKESLQKTVDFASELMENRQLAAIEAQPLYPLKNARAGRWLMNPETARSDAKMMGFQIRRPQKLKEMPEKWGNSDSPDPHEISKDWVEIFCHVTYEDLQQAASQIKQDALGNNVHFGSAW